MNNIEKRKTTIADLVINKEQSEKMASFQAMINQAPPKEWIKDHPFIKGYKYLPIERVESMLRSVFQKWEWKVNDYRVIANSITVHGTLRVLEPVTNEWLSYDGLGAVDIQMKSGSTSFDFSNIVSGAIQKNLPAAESYALKDAAEKLGTIFGGNLNRKDEINFKSPYGKWDADNI